MNILYHLYFSLNTFLVLGAFLMPRGARQYHCEILVWPCVAFILFSGSGYITSSRLRSQTGNAAVGTMAHICGMRLDHWASGHPKVEYIPIEMHWQNPHRSCQPYFGVTVPITEYFYNAVMILLLKGGNHPFSTLKYVINVPERSCDKKNSVLPRTKGLIVGFTYGKLRHDDVIMVSFAMML